MEGGVIWLFALETRGRASHDGVLFFKNEIKMGRNEMGKIALKLPQNWKTGQRVWSLKV